MTALPKVGGMDPHPITGELFASPVPPGSGWPGEAATRHTSIARSAEEVATLAARAVTLDDLAAEISVCRACPRLVAWREDVARVGRRKSFAAQPYWGRPVPSFGDPEASLLIVGLAPAANGANRTGRVFTGDPSGDFLFAALHRTGFANQPESVGAGDGLELRDVRIVASVRCAPPANAPTPQEKAACRPWLARELELSAQHVRSILALGAIGWTATLTALEDLGWQVPRPLPKFAHGAQVQLIDPAGAPVTLVGCYHVSPHNTYTGRLTPEMLDEVLRSVPRASGAKVPGRPHRGLPG